jgi:hypothetical protein
METTQKTDNEIKFAEFMGLKSRVVGSYHRVEVWYKDDPENWFSFPDYMTWNSLMPVVEKINESANVTISPGICRIEMKIIQRSKFAKAEGIDFMDVPPIAEYNTGATNMINIYHACLTYIHWYNQQVKP